MKIWVYAIAKNEEQFCKRFMASCTGADGVSVLDTGSTDGTVEQLRELGAHVEIRKIAPWRFDTARNESLKLVPEDVDVCICLDLDEVLSEGWREAVEHAWGEETRRGRYLYVWSHNGAEDGVTFYADKIHSRHGWTWKYPVHEVLSGEGEAILIPGLRVDHWPDDTKSRAAYLPLLELAVSEDPANDRNMHYLGREYYFHRQWGRAIETLMRHLAMPSATWRAERAASMRYIARCCAALGDERSAAHWLVRAAQEAPTQREAPYELAMYYYRAEQWAECLYWARKTLAITQRDNNYMTDPAAWGAEPYDLAAIAAWHMKEYGLSVYMAAWAVKVAPEDERLRNNLSLIRRYA